MSETLSVLVAASEASPLAQTGGLGEVTGSLPLALRDLGFNVSIVMPAYRSLLDRKDTWETIARDLPVRLGGLHLSAQVLSSELAPGVPAYLIRRDELFDRSGLYGNEYGEYYDTPERYVFFSRAVAALGPKLGFYPDILMANDWQTGLVMPLLDLAGLPGTAGVFTVHNQGYLGLVPPDRTDILGLPGSYYTMDGLEYYGQMSLLKAGIVYSQAVTTVSPTYAREVQSPEGGHGLDGVMKSAAYKLTGILNGVDYSVWNPATDQHLAAHYKVDDLSGKSLCKIYLLRRMGLLEQLRDKPIMGMVTRLTAQKGLSLLSEAADDIFKQDVGLVVLGSGEPYFEDLARNLKDRFPDRVGLELGYDPVMAHEIIAGSDMLLMPSMYEPCGLAQMYGLKYGTVPIVRSVGGLNDTVRDQEENNGPPTGFKFGPFQARALVRAVRRAVEAWKNQDGWREIMRTGMNEDFSWGRSAREYAAVFEQALRRRRG